MLAGTDESQETPVKSLESPVIKPLEVLSITVWMIIKHPILLLPQIIGALVAELLGIGVFFVDLSWFPRILDPNAFLDVVYGLGAWIVGFLIVVLSSGMYPFLVRNILQREKVKLGCAARAVLDRILALILAAIIVILLVAVGFLLFIIPGLIFYTWYYCTTPALMLEGKGATEAMRASKQFTKGRGWPIFAIIVVWILVNWLLTSTIDLFPFTFLLNLFLSLWASVLPSYLYLVYNA